LGAWKINLSRLRFWLNKKWYRLLIFILILLATSLVLTILIYGLIIDQKFQKERALEEAESQKIVSTCKFFRSTKEACLINAFDKFSKNNNLDITLAVLKEVQKKDDAAGFCHGIAHIIANNEVEKDPKKWKSLINSLDIASCSDGFFHGLLEKP